MADFAPRILVLDATLLNHSARADNIDLLGAYLQKYECLTTEVVIDELQAGYGQYPELRRAVGAGWITSDPLDTIQGITSYATWLRRVGGGARHWGEASVFACAEIRSGLAITDDREAARVAGAHGLEAHGTLWLLARLLKEGAITDAEAGGFVDALATNGARLPCRGRSFADWCKQNGLV